MSDVTVTGSSKLGNTGFDSARNNTVNGVLDFGLGVLGKSGVINSTSGGSAVGAAANAVLGMFGTADRTINSNDALSEGIRDKAFSFMLESGNPLLMGIGTLGKITDKTGGFTDASKGLGGLNDTVNFAASLALPGAGWFTSRLPKYEVSDTLAQSSGYRGTAFDN